MIDIAWERMKFLTGTEYGRAMARAHFLQPARASLVQDWVGCIRSEFPERAKEMDIAAFADGHLKEYSVVAEVFADQDHATRLALDAWDRIFTLGQAPVTLMIDTCAKIEQAQASG